LCFSVVIRDHSFQHQIFPNFSSWFILADIADAGFCRLYRKVSRFKKIGRFVKKLYNLGYKLENKSNQSLACTK